MARNSLDQLIRKIRESWGPLSSDLSEKLRSDLSTLAKASSSEKWIVELLNHESESTELYRDPDHGFVILAHTEKEGLYRTPHDHGNGWVVYAVHRGEMEMRTYGQIDDGVGPRLVRRDTGRVRPGESRIYLPGDIHDTKCISSSVLMFRLTSCDLKIESAAGRLHRYENPRS